MKSAIILLVTLATLLSVSLYSYAAPPDKETPQQIQPKEDVDVVADSSVEDEETSKIKALIESTGNWVKSSAAHLLESWNAWKEKATTSSSKLEEKQQMEENPTEDLPKLSSETEQSS